MTRSTISAARLLAVAGLGLGWASAAHGFLGFADTSFVTVIANPAEAANWAAELEKLNEQLAAANGTLTTLGELRAFAGDPRSAVDAVPDLAAIRSQVAALAEGAQTGADLLRSWQSLDATTRLADARALLMASGASASMQVFGNAQARDAALYESNAREASSSAQLRLQVASEQAARSTLASELALAWSRFKASTTESGKQAILAEISQLQSQNQVMDTRRRAILDDLELSDRQGRAAAAVRSKSQDEQLLAESSALNSSASGRARDAEAQRLATLQKTAGPRTQPDYSALRLWTTADTGGSSN